MQLDQWLSKIAWLAFVWYKAQGIAFFGIALAFSPMKQMQAARHWSSSIEGSEKRTDSRRFHPSHLYARSEACWLVVETWNDFLLQLILAR